MSNTVLTIKRRWKPGSLSGDHRIAESIAAKDLNNLYLTSCYFKDPERYRAFCSLYAIMRVVDDRVDSVTVPEATRSAEEIVADETHVLEAWREAVMRVLSGSALSPETVTRCDDPRAPVVLGVLESSVKQFPTPGSVWEAFFDSMKMDLGAARFETFNQFLRYAEGAAVAPTTIYLYLITSEHDSEADVYEPAPGFDLLSCGRELGVFAYLAHILRDLRGDLASGMRRAYLSLEDMTEHRVTEQMLHDDLLTGRASQPLRSLTKELCYRSKTRLSNARELLRNVGTDLSADREFVLAYIVEIYEEILRKIASCSYDVMGDRHVLTEGDKSAIAVSLARKMALALE